MAADVSSYATLGLEPGADRAAIEQAYKRLIKQHHPDRQGGDSSRAAEINRAYRELRAGQARDPLEFNDQDVAIRRGGLRWPVAALLVAGAAAALLVFREPVTALVPLSAHLPPGHPAAGAAGGDVMAQPLHMADIDLAARQALRLSRTTDEMAMAEESRGCQRLFQNDPGLRLLDRCAAFDDAVAELQDRDPLGDGGPFAPLAVTGRQWSAATGLSNDYLAIDSRLNQIRIRVELTLAPHVQPVAPPVAVQRVADASAAPPPPDCVPGPVDLPSGC